jgi:hypothetical protein
MIIGAILVIAREMGKHEVCPYKGNPYSEHTWNYLI